MDIIVAQTRIYGQDIKRNFNTMQTIINKQKPNSLLVFPDLALIGGSGYILLQKKEYQDMLKQYHDKIAKLSEDKMIVWGSIADNIPAIFVAYKGLTQRFNKQRLRDNNYYSESKYYKTREQRNNVLEYQGKTISFNYETDEMRNDADINLVLADSFWIKGITEQRLNRVADYTNPVVYVNSVGTQNISKSVFVYDGGSFYKKDQNIYAVGNQFEQVVKKIDDDWASYDKEFNMMTIQKALITLIKQFDEEVFTFKPNWVIGLSGGLDSAVSFALLVMALGKERVIPVTMPSKYNRDITKNNAGFMAENFEVPLITIPVGDLALGTVQSLKKENIDVSSGLAYENIQARLRGHLLMSVSSAKSGVVVNNGNKIESALGYATMYGDAIGALSPLADLSKIEVGLLANAINETYQKEMIPKNLIPILHESHIEWDFAPSAELAKDQFDPMKWGYHDLLIEYLLRFSATDILESYLDDSIYELPFGRYLKVYGLDKPETFIEDFEWVLRQLNNASFKRLQMPPIAVLSDVSFGNGYAENQQAYFKTNEYERLKEKILNK